MSFFNEKLKTITLKEILILIICLFIIQNLINLLNIVYIDNTWIYIFMIFYFVYKLKGEITSIKSDIFDVFNPKLLKIIILTVILNIFLAFGMLYLSDSILNFNFFKSSSFLSGNLIVSLFVSPISEELIFRGVFLNRFKLIFPTVFSVLISSLIFATLHSFGAIFSAFIFGICVSILYLKTDNIFVPIFVHFLNNLFAEIISILDADNILLTNNIAMTIISILAIFSLIIILFGIYQQFKILNSGD